MCNNSYTLIISGCFIMAFAWLVGICIDITVYPPITVEGLIGGSVVLPCASSENEHNLQDTMVLWRHNDSLTVYDIIRGRNFLEKQNSVYKNRAESFPEELVKGNFSLRLKNLTHSDAGKYKCYIIHSSEHVIVQLLLKEAEGNPMLMKIFISVLCIAFIIFTCIVYKMKGG